MAPEAQSFKTIESQQLERDTPEGIRTAEAERVACAILQQRSEQICAPLVAEGKKPESRRDKMYGFFHTLKTLPETPTPKTGVPEGVQEDKTDKGPPLTIRITEMKVKSGEPRRFQVAEAQDSKIKIANPNVLNSYNLEVKTIHYKDRATGMVYLTADRKGNGDSRSSMEVAIHESELMMAYLSAEQQEILNDSELSEEQQKLLALQIKTSREGKKVMADAATTAIISNGAHEAGLITRDSIQKIAPTLSEEKVNSILGKDGTVATVDQTMRVFEEAGMFDVNEAKALQQEAAAGVKAAQTGLEAASADLTKYAAFDGKVTGEVIQIDGQDYTITDTDISNLQAARKTFESAQRELRNAQRDLTEVTDMVKKAGAGGEMEGEMKKYLLKIENGDIAPSTARKFLRGVESKNIDAVFEAVMEEKLNGIKDAEERERKKAEMKAKFNERRDAALKYGGIALMVLLMMMKDSAKQ